MTEYRGQVLSSAPAADDVSYTCRPAVMDDFVRPACLHTDMDGDPSGLNAIATGWGATGDGKP